MVSVSNLYKTPSPDENREIFSTLFQNRSMKIESIRSNLKEAGEWYDQNEDEWVVLLEGEARLQVGEEIVVLERGESLFLPAHTRHRVLSTSKDALWLGVFSF